MKSSRGSWTQRHMEFRPDYGPEIYAGLVAIDGMRPA